MYLIPAPVNIKLSEEKYFNLCYNCRIIVSADCDLQTFEHARILKRTIYEELGFDCLISKGRKIEGNIVLSFNKTLKTEEYHLVITELGVEISGGSNAGILYGIQSLRQIIEAQGAVLSGVEIKDFPDMANRGFYHDVTRGRIPTLETLKALADKAAYYKLNQLQLYIEHSFLFRDFSEVWRDDTPLTAEEILEFDGYCKNLHIDLIPSIASFGHLYKVLRTQTYAHLCELENSHQEPFSFYERMAHHTLDISSEESFQFVVNMIEEYMPLFSSGFFNICADETFDLGKGKSKGLSDKIGTNEMYINFLKRICEFIVSKKKIPMFWGDIICDMPEAVQALPGETICLNWGYAPDHSEEGTKKLAMAGATQYICPGVSGWNRLINNLRMSYDNIRRMCSFGRKYGAIGVLNTDWGDFGHVNHPEFSTAGLIYGAVNSWKEDIPEFEDLNESISYLEYGDSSKQFLNVIAQLDEAVVVTWFEVICFMELKTGQLKREPYSPVLKEITPEKVAIANTHLDELIRKIYEIMSGAKREKRNLYGAYILAAEGIKLWNEIGGVVSGCDTTVRKDEANTLAVRLEYWYHEYKKLWRSTSKEAELYRIGEVIFWYADYLRILF